MEFHPDSSEPPRMLVPLKVRVSKDPLMNNEPEFVTWGEVPPPVKTRVPPVTLSVPGKFEVRTPVLERVRVPPVDHWTFPTERELPEERFREPVSVKERPPDPVVLITPLELAINREPPPLLPELEDSPERVIVPTLFPPVCQLVKTMLEPAS